VHQVGLIYEISHSVCHISSNIADGIYCRDYCQTKYRIRTI